MYVTAMAGPRENRDEVKFPVAILHPGAEASKRPLCDSGDVYFDIERGTRLPNYRLLPEHASVGDLLALLNTGAYALDQASQYNGRPIPAAVMVMRSGEVKLARRRETYEDLCSRDVW